MYYSISEVAESLGETVVTVRYWTNSFSRFLSPGRSAKGNRQYRESDIATLGTIRRLTREEGLSLDAVKRKLARKEDGTDKSLWIRDALLEIRQQLEEIKKSL